MRTTIAFAAAAVLAAGCASRGYEQSESVAAGIRQAGDAAQRLDDAGQAMLAALDTLTGEPRQDLPARFAAFSSAVDTLVSAEGSFRKTLESARGGVKTRFAAWEQELTQYSNADIRAKSEGRMKEVKESFQEAGEKADAILPLSATLVSDSQDLRRLLSSDLTPSGLDTAASASKKLRSGHGDVKKAGEKARKALGEAAEAFAAAPPPPPAPAEEPKK